MGLRNLSKTTEDSSSSSRAAGVSGVGLFLQVKGGIEGMGSNAQKIMERSQNYFYVDACKHKSVFTSINIKIVFASGPEMKTARYAMTFGMGYSINLEERSEGSPQWINFSVCLSIHLSKIPKHVDFSCRN
jgi:hypothetical protein